MDSKKYWRAREEAQRQKDIKDADKYASELKEIYKRAYFDIQDKINAFYTKYATENGLSMAEVKKKVSSLDIERYNRLAEKYVKNKDLSKTANEAMRIYNITMKINRLEMLKSEIGMELASNFSNVEGLFNEALNKTATAEIERQAGILGNTVADTTKKADAIVNSSFNNATFSDRIWIHQEALRQDLNRVISNSIIQGKHPRTFIKDIVDRFDVSKSQADRLLITEVCRVQTEVQKQSYERDGYTEYEFIAEPTACQICKGLDGHIYKVSKMMPGDNAPPLHPRCRCSTAPYMDRAEFDKWLEETSKSLKNEEIEIVKRNAESIHKININNIKKSKTNGIENVSIINVVRSLSATGKKYPVKALDSKQHGKLLEGQTIEGHVFAGAGTETPIKDIKRLVSEYGIPAKEWKKSSGIGLVKIGNHIEKAELHWYEAKGQKFEIKIKRYIDNES